MRIIHVQQPNRKTYSLQFDYKGDLVVKTDIKYFGNKLDEILEKHKKWIKQNFKKVKEQVSVSRQNFLEEGYEYSILGEKYKLIYRVNNENKFFIFAENNNLVISQPQKGKLTKSEIKKELISYFRIVARKYLSERTEYFTEKANLKFRKIFIKNQKTKWGSCSSEKNLNYNWHLIFAPLDVIDYVVIHEISHLKYMNHSKTFWNLVEKFDPDYKVRMKWLRENEQMVRILN